MSKVRAIVHDTGCLLSDLSLESTARIKAALEWSVSGAKFSDAFKTHRWDGKARLWKEANGGLEVPIGMMKTAMLECKRAGQKVVATDKRTPVERVGFRLSPDLALRPHQIAAIEAATKSDIFCGIGTLKMPVRSGKTLTGAAVIAKLDVRTLFVVPTLALMYQAAREIGWALGEECGLIGDDHRTIRRVTVANAGSLAAIKKSDKKTFNALKGIGLLMVDEMHHMRGGAWTKACNALRPRYRIGLSATVYFEDDREIDRGILHAMALCGPVIHDVSITEMVRAGYLVAPTVHIHRCTLPTVSPRLRWSAQTAATLIHENPDRNEQIVSLAVAEAQAGRRVIIICTRVAQVDALAELLQHAPVRHSASCGGDNYQAAIRDLINRERPIAVTTTLGEGVNVPEVDAVIIAAGGRDAKATMQRLRCLTSTPTKTSAVVHDFWDSTHPYVERHSEDRLAVYRSEPCFQVVFEDGEQPRRAEPAEIECPF